jgi:hypothetical protein
MAVRTDREAGDGHGFVALQCHRGIGTSHDQTLTTGNSVNAIYLGPARARARRFQAGNRELMRDISEIRDKAGRGSAASPATGHACRNFPLRS